MLVIASMAAGAVLLLDIESIDDISGVDEVEDEVVVKACKQERRVERKD
jgi:hypothetical protein